MDHSNSIGIDFGMTKITVSAWFNGHSEIITTNEGERYTPSCMYFTEEERLFGSLSDSIIGKYPWNFLSNFKRYFCSNITDPIVQKDLETSSCKIEADDKGNTTFLVNYRGERHLTPEQIAAALFCKLKSCAEKQFKHEVKYAVLSIPYTFSMRQIETLKDAALVSGLYILSTVTEGALAGAEFAWGNIDKDGPGFILFFNMGGGYTDISLCRIRCGSCFVMCTGGCEIGGVDMDNALISYCMKEYTKKSGKSLDKNYKALRKLRSSCEKAKKILSSVAETVIDIPCLVGDEDFSLSITRDKFEELNKDVFHECRNALMKLMNNTKITKDMLNEIILLGGSTRVPKIKQLVQTFFEKVPKCNINADEAVANGAAIHAAFQSNELYYHHIQLNGKIYFNDVLTSDIGIKIGEEFIPVLLANTGIPGKREVKTNLNSSTELNIYERKDTKMFLLETIEIDRTNELIIEMEIDEMNIISGLLKYKNKDNKLIQRGCVISCKNKLTTEEIDIMIAEEEKFKSEDIECIRAKDTRNDLEKLCGILRNQDINNEKVKKYVIQIADYVMNWVEGNGLLKSSDYTEKKLILEKIIEFTKQKKWDKLKEITELPEDIQNLLV